MHLSNKVKVLLKLLPLVLAVIAISCAFCITFIQLSTPDVTDCKCVDGKMTCKVQQKLYTYHECKKYGMTYDKSADRLRYTILADIRWFVIIEIVSTVGFVVFYIISCGLIHRLYPWDYAISEYHRLLINDEDEVEMSRV